ncbi:hypothetical protein AB0B28_03935 [Glycomyces sp. NPDC046736]|uniref:hypothetical protein n=1 Tax=Glycomyces sp. NPDC046736 TaxID=3155615 RepID=UPI0033C804D7
MTLPPNTMPPDTAATSAASINTASTATAFTTTMRAKLGDIAVEGRRIELVWLTALDSVQVSFTDLEPNRIGTVIGLASPHARLVISESEHLDWVSSFNRADLIVVAVIEHYRHRETLARCHIADH